MGDDLVKRFSTYDVMMSVGGKEAPTPDGTWVKYKDYKAATDRITELEAANDAAEKDHNISSEGNLWRFWSKESRGVATKNVRLRENIKELEDTLSLRTNLHGEATYLIHKLEAKLAKAVEALEFIDGKISWEINPSNYNPNEVCDMNADWCEIGDYAEATLAELKK